MKKLILLLFMLAVFAEVLAENPLLKVGAGQAFQTIAQALEAAAPYATIEVLPGIYHETELKINKPLNLVGIGFPVIDARGEGQILLISSDSVRVSGFEIRNSGNSHTRDLAAIRVELSENVIIENNRLFNNFFSIYLAEVNGVTVRKNIISAGAQRESNSGNGIHMWNSKNVTVDGNQIRHTRDGIYLEFVDTAIIINNISEDNIRYGLHYMFTKNSKYSGNIFRRNGAGVAVMYSNHVEMNNNLFSENQGPAAYGLLLKDITDSQVSGNTFRHNTIAVYSEGSSRINITKNILINNGYAVKIMANSIDNLFEANNFIDNTFDVTTNSRRNFNTFQGNYWSRYDGYDLTGNGIGDVPYRPVRLFALIVEQNPVSLILLRSFFIDLLDVAERVMPVLTPETLLDEKPLMKEVPL